MTLPAVTGEPSPKELTDEWQEQGVQQDVEYAILANEITCAWSGVKTRQYKKLKH